MFRDFATILKDMTASSVHTPTALGNEDDKKAKPFKAVIAAANAPVAKRSLQPNVDGATAKSPFLYDPNALGSLRPDQVPRFFGALTDSDKLPTKEVKLDDLHAMQDRVDPAKVKAIGEHGTGGKHAVVVAHNGKHYIADGHHRLAADWLAGKETATVAFKDLEPVDQALKSAPKVGPKIGDTVSVESDLGAASNAPWTSKVTDADGWKIKVAYDDGEDWYRFDPKDLSQLSDDGTRWTFKKRHVVAPTLNVRVCKVDETLGVVLGWAIVCKVAGEDYYDLNIDHEGPHAGKRVPEHVPEPVMAKSGLQFVESGAIGNEMHEGPDVGTYPFVFPMTSDAFAKLFGTSDVPPKTGLLVGYRPPADVLTKFKTGEYRGFSIEGRRISFEEQPQ